MTLATRVQLFNKLMKKNDDLKTFLLKLLNMQEVGGKYSPSVVESTKDDCNEFETEAGYIEE